MQYREIGDPISFSFRSAQFSNQPWIDLIFTLLLLIAIALPTSASTRFSAIDTISASPSPSPSNAKPANTPSTGVNMNDSVPISAPSQSNESASNTDSNDSTSGSGSDLSSGFDKPYQNMTILIVALFVATLIIGFCTHYVTLRACGIHRPGRRGGAAEVGGQGLLHEGGRGGLDPWIVRSLPTVQYNSPAKGGPNKAEAGGDAGEAKGALAIAMMKPQECAVCLSEFEEGEEMKALPKCRHAFHGACIDMWLYSHTTCPICRLSLAKVSNGKRKPVASSTSSPRAGGGNSQAQEQREDTAMSASTSIGPRIGRPVWHEHVDEGAEDARNSSAALFPYHFTSSS